MDCNKYAVSDESKYNYKNEFIAASNLLISEGISNYKINRFWGKN